ncbi:desulfoferrodoxin family protein [Desulfurivibrio sp. D14AmB]|uniref:desulfoferrodoxin family protein n=1 Tax=Desulfurivibrio sp. D14AmB TaxID=3374370 RepID=UPI00376EEF39
MQLKRREFIKIMAAGAVAAVAHPPTLALANKSAVTIEAPATAARNAQVTIRLQITHRGNNFIHYTNWVTLRTEEGEIGRWDFSAFDRPENNEFSREVTIAMEGTTQLIAQANCNIHGSEGEVRHTIVVQDR